MSEGSYKSVGHLEVISNYLKLKSIWRQRHLFETTSDVHRHLHGRLGGKSLHRHHRTGPHSLHLRQDHLGHLLQQLVVSHLLLGYLEFLKCLDPLDYPFSLNIAKLKIIIV